MVGATEQPVGAAAAGPAVFPRYVSAQLHCHSSIEGPASIGAHCYEAARAGHRMGQVVGDGAGRRATEIETQMGTEMGTETETKMGTETETEREAKMGAEVEPEREAEVGDRP